MLASMDDCINIEFSDELDLHHFHARDAKELITEFLNHAEKKGYSRVRIIHGKGSSVMKSIVYTELARRSTVLRFSDDGSNWGATIVYLACER